MVVLQIEHAVPSYEGWRKAFESDPIDRKKSGVLRYRIYRPVDNPNYIIVDLEFDNVQQAADTLTALRKLWGVVEGKVIMNPQTRMLDVVETVDISK